MSKFFNTVKKQGVKPSGGLVNLGVDLSQYQQATTGNKTKDLMFDTAINYFDTLRAKKSKQTVAKLKLADREDYQNFMNSWTGKDRFNDTNKPLFEKGLAKLQDNRDKRLENATGLTADDVNNYNLASEEFRNEINFTYKGELAQYNTNRYIAEEYTILDSHKKRYMNANDEDSKIIMKDIKESLDNIIPFIQDPEEALKLKINSISDLTYNRSTVQVKSIIDNKEMSDKDKLEQFDLLLKHGGNKKIYELEAEHLKQDGILNDDEKYVFVQRNLSYSEEFKNMVEAQKEELTNQMEAREQQALIDSRIEREKADKEIIKAYDNDNVKSMLEISYGVPVSNKELWDKPEQIKAMIGSTPSELVKKGEYVATLGKKDIIDIRAITTNQELEINDKIGAIEGYLTSKPYANVSIIRQMKAEGAISNLMSAKLLDAQGLGISSNVSDEMLVNEGEFKANKSKMRLRWVKDGEGLRIDGIGIRSTNNQINELLNKYPNMSLPKRTEALRQIQANVFRGKYTKRVPNAEVTATSVLEAINANNGLLEDLESYLDTLNNVDYKRAKRARIPKVTFDGVRKLSSDRIKEKYKGE